MDRSICHLDLLLKNLNNKILINETTKMVNLKMKKGLMPKMICTLKIYKLMKISNQVILLHLNKSNQSQNYSNKAIYKIQECLLKIKNKTIKFKINNSIKVEITFLNNLLGSLNKNNNNNFQIFQIYQTRI